MASVLIRSSVLMAVLMAVPAFFGDFFAYQISLFLIYGIAAQGIGYLWGKVGILPLGQAFFFGLAAYVSAITLGGTDNLGLQILGFIASIAVLALFAFALAALIFRGRAQTGAYFSLITLALVLIAEQLAGTLTNLTGGFNGLGGFDSLGGLDPFGNFYYFVAIICVLVSGLLWRLNQLPANLAVKAVFDNEPRLQLLGFPTHLIKACAFAFSAALAALAGVLFASHQGIVTPTAAGFSLSAELVILTAVGGRFHVLGPLLGAVLIGLVSAELRDSFAYWELVVALVFIAIVLKAPGGMAQLLHTLWERLFPTKPDLDRGFQPAPATKQAMRAKHLCFDDVRLQIGQVKILNGISISMPQTGIISIIGPNGAGKTSALNTITGNLKITQGALRLDDKPIHNKPPYQALSHGIGRKLQVPSVFFSMDVQENLTLASMAGRARFHDFFSSAALRWRPEILTDILNYPNVPLSGSMYQTAQNLPQGHRQFLEFAMTAASGPAIMLLDEPCAGLSPGETALMTQLVALYQKKIGGLVIMIEHDMQIVAALSQKVLVLHQGAVLAFDDYASIKADPAVKAVYAGGTK